MEPQCASVSNSKLPADLSGLPANLSEKNFSFHEALSASCPGGDADNDDADNDASFRELLSFFRDDDDASPRDNGKRPRDDEDASFHEPLSYLPSPRTTDNNTSETPVVDDDFLHVDKKPCLDRDKKPGLMTTRMKVEKKTP